MCIDSVDEDKILAEGVSKFCSDLRLDPASITVLIIAWKLQVHPLYLSYMCVLKFHFANF